MDFYSKQMEHHSSAVALFVAHFNLCRVPSAHKQTPADAAGLTVPPELSMSCSQDVKIRKVLTRAGI
jgi:hypothetical protein